MFPIENAVQNTTFCQAFHLVDIGMLWRGCVFPPQWLNDYTLVFQMKLCGVVFSHVFFLWGRFWQGSWTILEDWVLVMLFGNAWLGMTPRHSTASWCKKSHSAKLFRNPAVGAIGVGWRWKPRIHGVFLSKLPWKYLKWRLGRWNVWGKKAYFFAGGGSVGYFRECNLFLTFWYMILPP